MNDSDVLDAIARIADPIALKNILGTNWSSWHNWESYIKRQNDLPIEQPPVEDDLGFGTCVDYSFRVAEELRTLLKLDPALAQYADEVKVLAGYDDKNIPMHTCVAILFAKVCLVLDMGYCATFRIPVKGQVDTTPYIDFEGVITWTQWHYEGVLGSKVAELSSVVSNEDDEYYKDMRFVEIDYDDAFEEINYRMAKKMVPSVKYAEKQVPSRKFVDLGWGFDKELVHLPSQKVEGYNNALVNRGILEVDFSECRLNMQIPYADWLNKPRNREVKRGVTTSLMYVAVNKRVCNVRLKLHQDDLSEDWFWELIALFGEIGENLGLPPSELAKIIVSLIEKGRFTEQGGKVRPCRLRQIPVPPEAHKLDSNVVKSLLAEISKKPLKK